MGGQQDRQQSALDLRKAGEGALRALTVVGLVLLCLGEAQGRTGGSGAVYTDA